MAWPVPLWLPLDIKKNVDNNIAVEKYVMYINLHMSEAYSVRRIKIKTVRRQTLTDSKTERKADIKNKIHYKKATLQLE